jgi:DNA modification methylase
VNYPFDRIVRGNCLTVLPKYRGAKIPLAVVDPPFNIGYVYDQYSDKMTFPDYLSWTGEWVRALKDVLSDTASLYVCIGDNAAAEVKTILDRHGFHLRSWIIWHYTFGVHLESKWGRGPHPRPLLHPRPEGCSPGTRTRCGSRVGPADEVQGQAGQPEGPVCRRTLWTFSRVCGTFKERTGHPCQMPVALFERIIRASSNPGDVVLDPMCGSGAALVAARMNGRRWFGVELSAAYAKAARERMVLARTGGPG